MSLVLVLIMLVIAPVLSRTRRRSQHARVQSAQNFSILEQVTAGIRVIKAMGSTEREILRYSSQNHSLFEANMRLARARAQSEALTAGGVCLIAAVALLTIGMLYQYGHVEPTPVLLCLGAMSRLITNMRELQRGWNDVQEQIPAVERVYQLLDRPSRVVDRPEARDFTPPRNAITVEQVRFAYPGTNEEVLRGLDITVRVGSTVALVGQTGSGKSTLLDLIPRFHDVTGGRIAIDGVDIRDLRLDTLVHHVAIVQQDSFLFNDTVYGNIAYGRPGATREEVEAAARRAHVHEAILALEGGKGYETLVGDRGGRLSGGQRQRVAIARALLRDAPILLLDEPTSALDADSEKHVQEALSELMRGRTTIVVAHRLATIQRADLICVLAPKDHPLRGTVLERGTHRELVELGQEYARLVKLQQLAV
jgi:subfamily B ATP-binding cassette protein MsbA